MRYQIEVFEKENQGWFFRLVIDKAGKTEQVLHTYGTQNSGRGMDSKELAMKSAEDLKLRLSEVEIEVQE